MQIFQIKQCSLHRKLLIIEDVVEALKDLFDLDDFFAKQFSEGKRSRAEIIQIFQIQQDSLLGKSLIIEDVVEALKDLFDLDDFFAKQIP
jgi:hypothetical protein